MLLPALSAARERARATQCLSNLKNIGLGLHMYMGASDDCLPSVAGYDRLWYCLLAEDGYLPGFDSNSRSGIFMCPSAPAPTTNTPWDTGAVYGMWRMQGNPSVWNLKAAPKCLLGTGYKYADVKNEGGNGTDTGEFFQIDNFTMVMDSWNGDANGLPNYYVNRSEKGNGDQKKVGARHNKSANVVFGDGHASTLNQSALRELGWSDTLVQYDNL